MKATKVNLKERVKMSKKEIKLNDADIIYGADASVRIAIDKLYSKKSEHRKTIAIAALLALIAGFAFGIYFSNAVVYTASAKAMEYQLKVQSQSKSQ